jgi:hypothetical protein
VSTDGERRKHGVIGLGFSIRLNPPMCFHSIERKPFIDPMSVLCDWSEASVMRISSGNGFGRRVADSTIGCKDCNRPE